MPATEASGRIHTSTATVAILPEAEEVDVHIEAQDLRIDTFCASSIEPPEKLAITPYAYAVPQGDQVWLNFINLFIDTIKLDGRLKKYAEKNKLGPIVAP